MITTSIENTAQEITKSWWRNSDTFIADINVIKMPHHDHIIFSSIYNSDDDAIDTREHQNIAQAKEMVNNQLQTLNY